jgi:ABC-type transporter Mla maintaining outer membrane lipid asymmetry ATPase subunit MlaF
MANPLVEFKNVKKRFAHLVVLDGVSLVVERGESVVVIGASGSGKSVLLKHIVGLLRPDHEKFTLTACASIHSPKRNSCPSAGGAGFCFRWARSSIR